MVAGSRLPVEMKFHPSDRELVDFYLFNKTNSKIECFNDLEKIFVKECDLYGCEEPWQIWESYGGHQLEDGEALHLFTWLKKFSMRGSRVSKWVGSGTWAGEDGGDQIVVGDVVGIKKRSRRIFREDGEVQRRRGREIRNRWTPAIVNHLSELCFRFKKIRPRAYSRDFIDDEIPHVMHKSQIVVVLIDSSTTTQSDWVDADDDDCLTTKFDWTDTEDDDVFDEFLNNLTWPNNDITDLNITNLFNS
ncbi:hypothetical protein QYF36_014614 [Acer negundo]|nr:hypothetical protein QYF36_014614 [Acer negundo]